MGDGLNGASDCPRIKTESAEYKVGWPTKRARKRLEQLVAARAITELEELADTLRPDVYRTRSDKVLALVTAGAHKVGGELWNTVMASEAGATLYLLSLVREHHPDATEEHVNALLYKYPDQVQVAIRLVTPNFYRLLGEERGLTPEQLDQLQKQATETLSQPG